MNRHGDAYLKKYAGRILPSHRRVINDIRSCRTEVFGGHVFHCQSCAEMIYAYHSCKNRHCPRCHENQAAGWIKKRESELLPVSYFHVVFTVPSELRALARSNQKAVYGAIMRCGAQALLKLCRDPKFVGGETGLMAVLHTWKRDMGYHPHVHCLVPAGGVTSDGRHWLPARKDYLLPIRALSVIFRGMLRDELSRQLPGVPLPLKAFRRRKWVAYIRPAHSSKSVLNYLARYVNRVAITDSNILRVTEDDVTYRYKDNDTRQWHTVTLPADKFMNRFLQHVLPRGFQKVRYFGIWHSSKRSIVRNLQVALPPRTAETETIQEIVSVDRNSGERPPPSHCPYCGKKSLVYVNRIRRTRGPPW